MNQKAVELLHNMDTSIHLEVIRDSLSTDLAQAAIDLKIARAVAAGARDDLLPIASQESYEDQAQRCHEHYGELSAALSWVNDLIATLSPDE